MSSTERAAVSGETVLDLDLRSLESVVDVRGVPMPAEPFVKEARERALASSAAAGGAAVELVATTFVSDLLASVWLETKWSSRTIDRIVARTSALISLPAPAVRFAIFARLLRTESLFALPPRLAIEAQLQMLTTFAPVDGVSLWTRDADGRPTSLLQMGDPPTRRARTAAHEVLTTNEVLTSARAQLQAVPVRRWNRAEAALVVRAPLEERGVVLGYVSECGRALEPLLEVENLIARHSERERSLNESTERLLVRLGLDLHDGPMQDIAALAQDLRLFRSQLAPFLENVDAGQILLGRLEDLDARLLAMDTELRELARSLQAPTTLQAPFLDLLAQDVDRLEERTGITVTLATDGDFQSMTSSQKIALLRVVHEALNNVHEHSGATAAAVVVAGERGHFDAQISDEGKGFDVEPRLVAAAKTGRLGLVGMSERVRMLGGRLDVESRPGGPTYVRAMIPRWRPLRPDESTTV